MVFSWEPALNSKVQDRVMMMRWSKKSIAIFAYKQRLWQKLFSMSQRSTKAFDIIMRCDMWHATCDMLLSYKYSLLSLHMKTKVVPFVRHSDIFLGHRWFFFDKTFSSTLSREFRVHRAGSQLKISRRSQNNFKRALFRTWAIFGGLSCSCWPQPGPEQVERLGDGLYIVNSWLNIRSVRT